MSELERDPEIVENIEADPAPKANANGAAPADAAIKLIPFRDLLAPDLTSKGLIKGLIDQESLVMIFGESGCGKTFLALDLALSVADGRLFFGFKTKKSRVVYLAAEAGNSIRNRVAAWGAQRWDEESEIDFRAIVSPVDLCDPKIKDAKRIAEAVGGKGSVDLLVIDTVSRTLAGGDENAPADMGTFINTLDRLRAYLGCATIAIHHTGKDANRGARGHSLLRCAVDTEIMVAAADGVSVATVTKQRDMPGGMELAFCLRSVELGLDQDGDPVRSCVIDPTDVPPPKLKLSPQSKTALDVLNRLVREGGTSITTGETGLTVTAVKTEAWRAALEEESTFCDNSKNFRMSWKRAQEKLGDGHILSMNDWVWPVVQQQDEIPFF